MSNLAAIGFDADTATTFAALLDRVLERVVLPEELGAWADHHRWFRDPSGAAMGLHSGSGAGGVECMTPFFLPDDGGTRWSAVTRAAHIDEGCEHCSGADCDLMVDGEMVTRSAVQWLWFDAYAQGLAVEQRQTLQVVGFASNLRLCTGVEALEAAQAEVFGEPPAGSPGSSADPAKPVRLAERSFLPHGMFANDGDLGARARALLVGEVEHLEHPRNALTSQRFTWARVRTLPGAIDVVAPFEAETVHTAGMLALTDVWLVGRPIAPPPAKPGS